MPSKSSLRRLEFTDDDDDFQLMHEGGKKERDAKYNEDKENHKSPGGFVHDYDRSYTDCWCTLIFIAFMASMIFLTWLGFTTGDVKKLMAPVVIIDGKRTLCGFKNETINEETGELVLNYDNTEFPSMVITDWEITGGVMGVFDSGVCVKECPSNANELKIECQVGGVACPENAEAVKL
jgi:hypothetical protein